jgi:hypothetical protein
MFNFYFFFLLYDKCFSLGLRLFLDLAYLRFLFWLRFFIKENGWQG